MVTWERDAKNGREESRRDSDERNSNFLTAGLAFLVKLPKPFASFLHHFPRAPVVPLELAYRFQMLVRKHMDTTSNERVLVQSLNTPPHRTKGV